jgi:hypothetical protein
MVRLSFTHSTLLAFVTSLTACSSNAEPQTAEAWRPGAAPQFGQAPLQLPGFQQAQMVTYQVIDGMAVYEGDILLGPAQELLNRWGGGAGWGNNTMSAVAVKNSSHLWPGAVLPYEIDGSVSNESRSHIQWAVGEAASAGLTLRPRDVGDRDYLVFRDVGEGCSSYVGRVGGPQAVNLTGCGRGSVLHEVLHAAGFLHEQSRGDRDQFVTIMWDDIIDSQRSNFEVRGQSAEDIGPYDYASIMHYSRDAFSKTGRPTILPRQNVEIGQRNGLSQGDRAAIAQLYGKGGTVEQPGLPGFPGLPGLPLPFPGLSPQPTAPGPGQPAAPGWNTPFGPIPLPGNTPLPVPGNTPLPLPFPILQ